MKGSQEVTVYMTKGSRVRIRTMSPFKMVALAGMQMKGEVQIRDFWGTVTHVYAYSKTKEDFENGIIDRRTVMVKPDDGSAEEEFDQKDIVGYDDKTVQAAQPATGGGGSSAGGGGAGGGGGPPLGGS